MAVKSYSAGVKEYRETYWMPDYTPADTDILACFKVTPQPGVPREEVAAAVVAMETWKEIKFEFDTVDKLDVSHK